MATRRDSKHRVLRRGESIRPDGKYQMQPKSEMAWVCLWLYITQEKEKWVYLLDIQQDLVNAWNTI